MKLGKLDSDCSALLVWGRSQMGKSSFVRLVNKGLRGPKVGSGDGTSCTDSVTLFNTILGPVLDAPGLDDSDLRFSPEDVSQFAAFELAKHKAKGLKILVFESLCESICQLAASIQELLASFGDGVVASIVVLATKEDLAEGEKVPDRIRLMEAVMDRVGVRSNIVTWQNNISLRSAKMKDQLSMLQEVLDSVPAAVTAHLRDLNKMIERKAAELCASQVPIKKKKKVFEEKVVFKDYYAKETYPEKYTVTKKVEEPYEDYETYDEWYTEYVPKVESYERVEQYEEPYTDYETYEEEYDHSYYDYELDESEKDDLRFLALVTFGVSHLVREVATEGSGKRINPRLRTERRTRTKTREVVRYRTKTRRKVDYRTVQVPVEKCRTKQRAVIKHRSVNKSEDRIRQKTRRVKKQKPVKKTVSRVDVVEVKAPVSEFLDKARRIVLADAKESFKQRLTK